MCWVCNLLHELQHPPTKNGDAWEVSGTTVDHISPYYLHPSDFPKQLLVNKVITDTNYVDWSQETEHFHFAKNKCEFIDRTIKKPSKGSTSYMSWMQYDAMLKGWKTTTMEKNIHNNVKYVGTVSQIWSELLERFGKESYDRPYELKYKITAARLDDETSSVMPFPYCSCQNFPVTLEKVLMSSKKKNDCISSSLA
uniref:Retrotransposon Copia-like N-terminal domain-containing protein n=1 Tax=Lactuca sativa TaxID=4236 RepID=A0A9R1V6H3_LACSA|nr:hypothetical protein LSAT_V11C600306340 [Lactuca sativa]